MRFMFWRECQFSDLWERHYWYHEEEEHYYAFGRKRTERKCIILIDLKVKDMRNCMTFGENDKKINSQDRLCLVASLKQRETNKWSFDVKDDWFGVNEETSQEGNKKTISCDRVNKKSEILQNISSIHEKGRQFYRLFLPIVLLILWSLYLG